MDTGLIRWLILAIGYFTKYAGALRFSIEPQSTVIRPCSSTSLRCAVDSPANIRWTVNGTSLTTTRNSNRWRLDGTALVITSPCGHVVDADRAVDGVYQCIATSSSDGVVVSSEARVDTAYLRPFDGGASSVPVVEVSVVEGNAVVIPCPRVDSRPAATIEFSFNGSSITPSTTLSGRHYLLPSGHLLIADVTAGNDAGFYRCVAYNAVVNSSVVSPVNYRLIVVAAGDVTQKVPTFVWTSGESVTVAHGQNLTLECIAQAVPVPTITWTKYGGQLPAERHRVVFGNLLIETVDRYDAGTYLCKALNGHGRAITKVITVHVSEPPLIETSPSDESAREGDTVTFRCRAQGSPTLSTQWLHNGISVNGGQSVQIKETTLTLLNVNRRQSGIYQCVVRNGYGATHAEARLVVSAGTTTSANDFIAPSPSSLPEDSEDVDIDPWYEDLSSPSDAAAGQKPTAKTTNKGSSFQQPNTPSKPRLTLLSDSSVRVQWTVPQSPSTQPASISAFKIQYRVEWSRGSSAFQPHHWHTVEDDIPWTQTAFDVTGLEAGVTYRFRVAAIYSNGDNRHGPNSSRFTLGSPLSDSTSGGRIESLFRGPTIVEVRAISDSEMFVAWQYDEDDRWPADGFYIEYAPYDAEAVEYRLSQLVIGPNARRATLLRLSAETSYSIRMQSYSGSGSSQTRVRSVYSNVVVKDTLAAGLDGTRPQATRALNMVATSRPEPSISAGVAAHLSPDNRTLFIVLAATIGIVIIVLTMSAVVCFKKQQANGRHCWHFETVKDHAKLGSNIHPTSRFKSSGLALQHVGPARHDGGQGQGQGRATVGYGRCLDDGDAVELVGYRGGCSSSAAVPTGHQFTVPNMDIVDSKYDEPVMPKIPTGSSAFHRPMHYNNLMSPVVTAPQFVAVPLPPPHPVVVLPPLQPSVQTSVQCPLYTKLTTANDQDDTSTFSSVIDPGDHQLTRWNNVDDLQIGIGTSSASEAGTTAGHRAPNRSRPAPPRRSRPARRDGPPTSSGGFVPRRHCDSDIDGDTSPMTSHNSTSSAADSVNSLASYKAEVLTVTSPYTSPAASSIGGHDDHYKTLADRVLDGAYQIQRNGVPN